LLSNAGELDAAGPTAQMLMFTARALKDAESAKRISSDGRVKLEKEFQSKTAAAVDQVAKTAGLTAETVEAIKAKILGITRPEAQAA
jgi:hypothetical protein